MIGKILVILLISFSAHAENVRVKLASIPSTSIEVEGQNLKVQRKKISENKITLPKVTSVTQLQGKFLRINQSLTPNKLILWPKDDKIDVIAVLELEEYLEGVLPHEMPASWPVEALKAQAIASRSYALALIKEKSNNPYHLNSTVVDQMYRFQDASLEPIFKRKVHSIIAETKGLVLKDSSGETLRAYYHSDCGGKTESPQAVWDNGIENRSATDGHCAKETIWSVNISADEFEKKMGVKEISDLKVIERSASGRVQNIVASSNVGDLQITGQELREKMGFFKLKSTLFNISKKDDRFVFSGKGFGHGVGMCQRGTRALAKTGKNYSEILNHYFPTASIKPNKNEIIATKF